METQAITLQVDDEGSLLGLDRTRKRLAEFERRLNALELTETVEFTDWRTEIGMLHLLERQYQALHETQVD